MRSLWGIERERNWLLRTLVPISLRSPAGSFTIFLFCASSPDLAREFRTETFGQVVLEALSSGTPVVGLRAEGVCDLVKTGETGSSAL